MRTKRIALPAARRIAAGRAGAWRPSPCSTTGADRPSNAGGQFTSAGGLAANYVARWDGATWSSLGTGTNHHVYVLKEFDAGSGPALYTGGLFTTAGGVSANHVARWDGASWSALGSGLSETVQDLTVYDDGGGPALYAGGAAG